MDKNSGSWQNLKHGSSMPCGHSFYMFLVWHHYMDLGGNQLKSFLGGETGLKLYYECGLV